MLLKDPYFQYVAYGCFVVAGVLFWFWFRGLMKMKPKDIPFVPSTGEGVRTSVVHVGDTTHILEVKGVATHSTVVDGKIKQQHAAFCGAFLWLGGFERFSNGSFHNRSGEQEGVCGVLFRHAS